ncbi:MAG: DUF1269 domain-containing protein [Chloroflexi bacterium]|nr:DUF1269 domain-containing protein [Chloroflexota bacterium]MBV9602664.1 DUF1269 domain-containing protein [Chloroflexota bacterium]
MMVKQLVALAYVDEHRAVEVLALLQRLHTDSAVPVQDAVGVVRGTDWNVKLHHYMDLAQPEDAAVPFWRGLIASLVLAPGTADCRKTGQDYGLLPEFEHELRMAMPPGSSAVFMLVTESTLAALLDELYRMGGTLLNSPIALCD